MKGMQKIKRGKQFAGVVLYSLKSGSHHKIEPYVIGGNMTGSNATELISEFDSVKKMRPDVTKSVWHNSLRLPEGESLTVRQWTAFADEYMARMGFTDTHLRCYILHDDFCGQHIHIIANRINMAGGKLYLGKNENLISTRIISELEIVHGLTRTTPATGVRRQSKRKPSRNELMMAERTAAPCPKSQLQTLIDNALTCRPDLLTFVRLLEQEGVACKPNIASTGKMNGFSFLYQGIAFKASQLGKQYGWSTLQKLIENSPEQLMLLKKTRAPASVPVPVPVPVPAKQLEASAGYKETLQEKIRQLEVKIQEERQTDTVPVIQLKARLHITSRQITQERQNRVIAWLPFIPPFLALLHRWGQSLLHAVTCSFRHFTRFHLLTPPSHPSHKNHYKQPVSNTPSHTPQINYLKHN